MSKVITREDALALYQEYNQDESLFRHALSVEAVMRHFAALFGEDVEKWGVIGLVHDLDYERYPDEHCTKVKEILASPGLARRVHSCGAEPWLGNLFRG